MYWYLDHDDEPVSVVLPTHQQAHDRVLETAKRISLARKIDRFVCWNKDGCHACRPLESVVLGKATFVGIDNFNQDIYVL